MKAYAHFSFAAGLLVSASISPAQKIIGPEKPALQQPTSKVVAQPPASAAQLSAPSVDAIKAGPGGGPWHGYGSGGGEGLVATLAKSGRFNTFLSIVKAAGMDDWERGAEAGWNGDGRTGFCDGSVRGAHWDGDGKVGIQDNGLHTGNAGFCDGSVHPMTVLAPNDAAFAAMDKGKLDVLVNDAAAARAFVMAHIVNGIAKGADTQNVAFSGGIIQEIDGVLMK